MVAYDINEKNIASSDGERIDLSHVANLKHQYSRIRGRIAHNTHKDRGVEQKLLSKYGGKECRRVTQSLHRVSKAVVEKTKAKKTGIIFEKLIHILRNQRREKK